MKSTARSVHSYVGAIQQTSCCNAGKDLGGVSQSFERWVRKTYVALEFGLRTIIAPEHRELFGALNRQSPERKEINYAEDGRVGGNAEGQRRYHDQGHNRSLGQHANAVAQV